MDIKSKTVGRIGLAEAGIFLLVLLLVGAMVRQVLGLWSMPITHRLVFGVVFAWTAFTSLELIRQNAASGQNE